MGGRRVKLTYNGIELPAKHSTTYRYDEEAQFADDGTYLYTRFTIGVQTVIATNSQFEAGGLAAGDKPTLQANFVRERLSQPRRELFLRDEAGTILLQSPSPGAAADSTRGPKPTRLSLKSFSPNSFIVDFEIQTDLNVCELSPPKVLRNAWDIQVSYHRNWTPTHEVSGQLVFSGHSETEERWVHVFAPPLMDGFVRQGWQYAYARDGLSVNYTFVDSAPYIVPPKPATTATGAYTESKQQGQTYANLNVHLEGPRDTLRGDLVILATKILVAYMTGKTGSDHADIESGILQQSAITVDLFNNSVDIRASWLKKQGPGATADLDPLDPLGVGGVEIIRKIVTDGKARDPGGFGHFTVNTLHALLKGNICNEDDGVAEPDGTLLPTVGQAIDEIQAVIEVDQLPRKPSILQSAGQNPYTDALISSKYVQNTQKYFFPPAAGGQSSSGFVAQVSAPVWYRVVDFQVERLNLSPDVPNPETQDDNEILIHEDVRPVAPQHTTDGFGELHGVRGRYVFQLLDVPDELKAGKLPNMNRQDIHALQDASFVEGLI